MLPMLLALLLSACGTGATAHSTLYTTPTPGPQNEYLAYIGAGGNIWRLSLPEGSTVQLTTDARPAAVVYSGLAWSPDGKLLAALRITHSNQNENAQLVVLRADGQNMLQAPLLAAPYGRPFAWSPNSRYIAYRILAARTSSSQALLVLLDARSGALHKALTYPFQQGCRGRYTTLLAAINQLHFTGSGIDTFGWTPDGNAMLASASCANDASLRIDLSSGTFTSGYPRGAVFQPGGNLLLGVWGAGSSTPVLELRDGTNALVRDLVTGSATSAARYPILAGQAVWTANGSQIYYEHADSIWRIDADGSNAHAIVTGTALDTQHTATVELAPAVSPDGRMLIYCELKGTDTASGTVERTWYLAAPDGANSAVLPDVTTEAVWQPPS
ncbi:MAG TPA: hypothetical protein VKQ30_11155 [Ktedonobacterales bacterium]|nr:hypothetical protein [Ktedonobacterales bacterium]